MHGRVKRGETVGGGLFHALSVAARLSFVKNNLQNRTPGRLPCRAAPPRCAALMRVDRSKGTVGRYRSSPPLAAVAVSSDHRLADRRASCESLVVASRSSLADRQVAASRRTAGRQNQAEDKRST